MSKIRTRFAPSPTGLLHIGGARTALFSWLYAKKMQGNFVLRIEDTDLERSSQESVDAILDAMQWLNLEYDEGPFYQTKRFGRYKDVIEQLVQQDKAYRCYCSKERLEALRNDQMAAKIKPRYDSHCRHLNLDASHPFVIRFKNPESGEVVFKDLIRGIVSVSNEELDDLIIARTDGSPTYNFTVVVDDWEMAITHVIRGDDHINNTPRQINILHALGATIPDYAHVPMILGGDGKRLSKRHGAVSVMEFLEDGFLPQALLNYLVRLGWSHGDQEIFSIEEMIAHFDLEHVNNSPAAFNEEKLLWINHHYLKTVHPSELVAPLTAQLNKLHADISSGPDLLDLIPIQAERCKTIKEMAVASLYFYSDISYSDEGLKQFANENAKSVLETMHQELSLTKDWSKEGLHSVIITVTEKLNLKLGKVAPIIRVAVTGTSVSPSLDLTLYLLGQDKVLKRLKAALDNLPH